MYWTLCLYSALGVAKEAGLRLKQYWDQVVKACFLDKKEPIKEWKKTFKEVDNIKNKSNKLSKKIDYLHVTGADVDLKIRLGQNRQWLVGSGCNIPSFEIFTSPDTRFTEGFINFNQPLYYLGNKVEGIKLEFVKGKVVKFSAKCGYKILKEMVKSKNADKVGEFSLTDGRLSRITKFMAETLYDENMGGKEGNTHIALGNSCLGTYTLDIKSMKKEEFENIGYNYSAIHTDIISTSKRKVVAILKGGSEKVIYKDGRFVL